MYCRPVGRSSGPAGKVPRLQKPWNWCQVGMEAPQRSILRPTTEVHETLQSLEIQLPTSKKSTSGAGRSIVPEVAVDNDLVSLLL